MRQGTTLPCPRTADRAVPPAPVTWLNLVCLDAPLVGVTWLCLFVGTLGIPLRIGNAVALFLTAWLIYLADVAAELSASSCGCHPEP